VLEVHAAHPPVHTWKDFFIHIATITIGLLIAVGLEQCVEVLHHRHQREQLEDQMRGVFETNLKRNQITFKQLKAQHAYFVELRTAISARLHGQPNVAAPAANDERMAAFPTFPRLSMLEAFHERFADSSGNLSMGQVVMAPNLLSLSAADLTEYLTIVSSLIKKTELLFARIYLVDKETRAILDGVRDEDDLLDKISRMPKGPNIGS
jgi:hypothetical protein